MNMICSVCKKNPAVVFINKIENNKTTVEGLCYNCAKEKGINPLQVLTQNANISEDDIAELSEQFGNFMNEINENGELDILNDLENTEDGSNPFAGILNLFKGNNSNNEQQENTSSNNSASAEGASSHKKVKVEKKAKNNKKKFLDSFGTNLTAMAASGKIDEVIGREQEILRVTQILNRRSKNNPCLIGEPGVGKTAIAQGLALKIARNEVPAKLLNKEVYLIDITAIVAGTQFRGQFESRMKSLIDECKTYGNIILVIDELHNIIGAGDAEHSMNAANILKIGRAHV